MIKFIFELDADWILYSLSYSYIKIIYCFITSTSPDIRAEAIQDSVLLQTFLNTFCGSVELSFGKVKREIFKSACTALYEAYKQIHVFEAQFTCIPNRTNTAELRPTDVGATTLDTCNIPAAAV